MNSANSEIFLGYQLNLIKGIKADWDTRTGKGSPFFPPDLSTQLKAQDLPHYDPEKARFDIYELSFHYSWKELNNALFIRWHIMDEELESNTGPFILVQPAEEEIRKNLCQKLGINQEDASSEGTGFALVKIIKSATVGKYQMNEPDLISSALKNVIAELPGDAVNAKPFLDFFGKYGTHFISEIEVGDMMFQVFIYDADVLSSIEKKFGKKYVTGIKVVSFQQYTQKKSKYAGYSKYAGKLNLASKDPAFEGLQDKFKDDANAIDCSIFIAIREENARLLFPLNHLIPIGCNLTNFSQLIQREDQKQVMRYVFRNALYQKYQENINPNFPPFTPPYDYATIYKSFQPPFVSTVSTTSMQINQIRLNLEDVVTLNPENVKTLFIFADVIEISRDVQLPGANITIICRKFIVHTQKSHAQVIQLTDEGYKSFKFYCQEFDGVAEVRNAITRDHKLISRGQSLQTFTTDDKQTTVVFYRSHTVDPPVELLRLTGDSTLYTLGLTLHSAESIIKYPSSKDALTVATLFVQWLADILESAPEEDSDLQTIRAQALMLLKSIKKTPDGILSVPYLTYEAYKPTIDAMMNAVDAFNDELRTTSQLIQDKKSAERISENQEELNRNIQAMGKFLVDQNKALADKERDVIYYHDQVNGKQKAMLADAQKKVDDLKASLEQQQNVMKKAEEDLKAAVAAYIIEQEIQACIQVAGAIASLFAGGAGISTLSDNLDKMKKIMIKIDFALKLIDSISKLYTAIDGTVQTIVAASNALSNLPKDMEFPSALDWNEFDSEILAAISPITGKVPYANTYLKETKILSARGRAYIDAASQKSKIEYDLVLNSWQKEISEKQSKRLDALSDTLHLKDFRPADAEKIDLFELGSIYQSHSERVILKLVNTLELVDAALQYYYLQAPTAIMSYDAPSLKEVVATQAQKSIDALNLFPSKPVDLKEPLIWTLNNIKIDQILDDRATPPDSPIDKDDYMNYSKGGYDFEIPLDVEQIINYVRVRITEIEMEIKGIKSTKSGKAFLRLSTAAHPFCDRGLKRETIVFNTIQQDFEYVYTLANGECVYTNKPSGEFAQFFMKMTPFTRWRISLPMGAHSENAGIIFSRDAVDVVLRIYLQAIRLSEREMMRFGIS